MKTYKILFLVVSIHVAGVVLLTQPGCHGLQPVRNERTDTPARSQSGELAPATSQRTQAEVASLPDSRLAEPTRPTDWEDEPLDPAFNAGLDVLTPLEPLPSDVALAPSAPDRTYTVQAGDTLTRIASREGITLSSLLAANNLQRSSIIQVGQSLRIPSDASSQVTSAASLNPGQRYTVVSGDTLSGIAARFGLTVSQLKSANALSGDTIFVGQTLVLPGVSNFQRPLEVTPAQTRVTLDSPIRETTSTRRANPPAPQPQAGDTTYVVQAGDSPGSIANRFNVRVQELMQVNNITDPRRLYVGRRLIIPDGGRATPAPTTTASNRPPQTEPSPVPVPVRVQPTRPADAEASRLDQLEALPEDDDDAPVILVEEVEVLEPDEN